jgi:hypothetical protein
MLIKSRRLVFGLLAASMAVTPLLSAPMTAAASGGGTLFAISGNQDVLNRVDLTTGALTPIANLAGPNSGQTGTLTVDPIAHLIYAVRTTVIFTPPSSISIVNEVLTINSNTGVFTVSKPVHEPVNQIVFDSSNHSLLIDGVNGIFHVDPVTGGVTALTHFDRVLNQGLSFMAIDPMTHTLYVNDEVSQPDGNFGSNILTIDSQTGALRSNLPLGSEIGSLGFDTSNGNLFSTVGCCTPQLVQIDPSQGTLTPLGVISTDPNVQVGATMAIDSSSSTIFMVANTFVCCSTSQSQIASIGEQPDSTPTISATSTDSIASLLFEPNVTVTAAGIIADVQKALASGGITKSGTAKTLSAELTDAQSARNRGQCGAAANIYGSFINDVTAQIGKAIAPATASLLVSEAQFLIANCP